MDFFFKSTEYKEMKKKYEKECFKLFGKYCKYNGEKTFEKSAQEMAEYFKNKKVTIEYVEQSTTKKGTTTCTSKEITKTFYQIWSEDPDMREYDELIFNCNLSKVKKNQFNLFDGFNHFNAMGKKEIDISLILEHIKSLVDFNNENFEYVLNYFAQLIQQPEILPHTTLIFISEEGVGKDIFATFLSEVIGEKYTYNTEKLDNICGRFNSVLGGKLMIVVNETNPTESRDRIENIKFLITAEKVSIEGKYKEAIKTDNYCRFVFFSNRLFAFPVEGEGSRRPVIFKSSSKYLTTTIGHDENHKFFSKLVSQYKNKEYQKAFLDFLKNRDISNFNPKKITKSLLHSELEENSISPLVGYLADIIKNYGDDRKIIRKSTMECYDDCVNYMKNNKYQYSLTPSKFTIEMVNTYKIKKIKSCGKMFFEYNVETIKNMLETKYKYNFNEIEVIAKEHNPLDGKPDYKTLYEEQQEEMMKLKQQINELNANMKLHLKEESQNKHKLSFSSIDELVNNNQTTKKTVLNPLDEGIEMIPETIVEIEDKEDDIFVNRDGVIIYDDEIDDDELNNMMLEIKEVKPKYKSKSKSKSKATFSLTKD